MSSSKNLYNYLSNHISKTSNDDSDNDLSIGTNLLTMTSSTSSDSAIVLDDFDDQQIKYRNSWPKMIEKNDSTLISFSQSFNLLNQLEQTIYNNEISTSKYKHPLPWINHSISSNKVSRFYFSEKKNKDFEKNMKSFSLF
jgi:hypothetical protein